MKYILKKEIVFYTEDRSVGCETKQYLVMPDTLINGQSFSWPITDEELKEHYWPHDNEAREKDGYGK